jgi:DNA polymerase/3'-5' exonuclease PolX
MSTTTTRLPLVTADEVAAKVLELLKPHCERIDIAGSIRRRRPTIGDLEIVCIPKPYDPSPLFCSGIATVVNQWEKVKGELPCRYTQRILPWHGMKLDLFMPHRDGYGLQLAIRTGSADWCRTVLAPAWVRAGYRSEGGLLRRSSDGPICPTPTEEALFRMIGIPWVDPTAREARG